MTNTATNTKANTVTNTATRRTMLGLIQAQRQAPALMALESVEHTWQGSACGSCNHAVFYVLRDRAQFQCEKIGALEEPPSDCSRWLPMPELLETYQRAATEALEAKKQAAADALVVLCQKWGSPGRATLCRACSNQSGHPPQCRIGINISDVDRIDGYPICQNFVLDPVVKAACDM